MATSVVIPYADPHENRQRVLDWILPFWEHHLPDAEFVIQPGPEEDFSKTRVLNEGVEAAKGDIIVSMDADALMNPEQLHEAIDIASTERAWVMPYGQMYRLSMDDTELVMSLDPQTFDPSRQVTPQRFREQARAVHFGAMCQVFPKNAFDEIGGFDERFVGWGSEDECMKIVLDTIWAPSHILDGPIYHMEHHRIGMNESGIGNGINRR